MKRYDFDRAHCTGDSAHGCPARMEESSIGDYVRWEDLIAAGCLVPVPDGEACSMTNISMFSLFACDQDGVWLKFGLDSWHYYASNIMTGEETALLDSVRVQPVRLVPLEDAQ